MGCVGLAAILAFSSGCQTARLQERAVFAKLSMRFAKDYPADGELERCGRPPSCARQWELFDEVERARKELLASPDALRRTLEVIEDSCVREEWNDAAAALTHEESWCRGASVALGFFLTEEEDARIRAELSSHPESVRAMAMTGALGQLLLTREDSEGWKELVRQNPELPWATREALLRVIADRSGVSSGQ